MVRVRMGRTSDMGMVPCRLQNRSHSLLGHKPCLTEGKVGSLQGFQVFL